MSENKRLTKEELLSYLEDVIDPELGIDIVNLGLIYDIEYTSDNAIEVTMTLTTMGCPYAGQLFHEVEQNLLKAPGIEEVEIDLCWYPAWGPERMTRYARIALGISG